MESSLRASGWILIAALCWMTTVAAADAERVWNEREVAPIAAELVPLVDEMRQLMSSLSEPMGGSPDRRDYYRLQEELRRIHTEARRLARKLSLGEDHDQTLPAYEDLVLRVRRAREIGKNIYWTREMVEKATAAREVLDRLAPYYDAQPLPPPLQP